MPTNKQDPRDLVPVMKCKTVTRKELTPTKHGMAIKHVRIAAAQKK